MQQLEGSCSVPIGVKCTWIQSHNAIIAISLCPHFGWHCLSLDGKERVQNKITIDLNEKLLKADICDSSMTCPYNYTALAINQMTDKIVTNRLRNSAILGYELAQSLLESGAKHI